MSRLSTKTRADRKADTKAAAKDGKLTPAGEGAPKVSSATEAKSTAARADVKADTKAAAKDGKLTPAGEGATAPKK